MTAPLYLHIAHFILHVYVFLLEHQLQKDTKLFHILHIASCIFSRPKTETDTRVHLQALRNTPATHQRGAVIYPMSATIALEHKVSTGCINTENTGDLIHHCGVVPKRNMAKLTAPPMCEESARTGQAGSKHSLVPTGSL